MPKTLILRDFSAENLPKQEKSANAYKFTIFNFASNVYFVKPDKNGLLLFIADYLQFQTVTP